MTTAFSDRLDRALMLAARAHRDQRRKGSDVPYVQHPAHVAILLVKHGLPEDVVIAGALHDVVEDTDVTLDAIRAEFGDDVAALVDAVTEKKVDLAAGGAPRPWRTRKEEQLAHLAGASFEVAALKAADALHNCATTLRDVRASGGAAWGRFNAGREEQLWWYRSLATALAARLGAHPLATELTQMVDALVANPH
jgi:(p)ppGpp synthase/HD superfamily hydrolase